jgi:phospholipid N-methyltransferase
MSVQYYQDNADEFFFSTVKVDMSDIYRNFTDNLKIGSLILDVGSGRDTKAFLDMGYKVDAFDASSELVDRAKTFTVIDVKRALFEDVNDFEKYDAIWCCASLLHVPKKELISTLTKLYKSLKLDGTWYMSFKYGESERVKDGRLFTDMNEDRLSHLISNLNVKTEKVWITEDNRPERNEKWINIILMKQT